MGERQCWELLTESSEVSVLQVLHCCFQTTLCCPLVTKPPTVREAQDVWLFPSLFLSITHHHLIADNFDKWLRDFFLPSCCGIFSRNTWYSLDYFFMVNGKESLVTFTALITSSWVFSSLVFLPWMIFHFCSNTTTDCIDSEILNCRSLLSAYQVPYFNFANSFLPFSSTLHRATLFKVTQGDHLSFISAEVWSFLLEPFCFFVTGNTSFSCFLAVS